MKILKSILNYIPLATFIIFVVTDGIFSLTSALIFVISTIGLLINWKRKKQRWRIEKIPVYRDDTTIIFAWKKEFDEKEKNTFGMVNWIKRGKILQIILKKRGKRDTVKKGGGNLCIEKTLLS